MCIISAPYLTPKSDNMVSSVPFLLTNYTISAVPSSFSASPHAEEWCY